MKIINKNEDLDKILFYPYHYEAMDVEDIKMRLDCMRPDNMFTIYHSQLLQQEKDANPKSFK